MFALEVRFLTGRYVASRADARDEPEWPPHPARLFSALVNTWAEGGREASEEAALRWLEDQPPPAMVASDHSTRPVQTVYVPPNDARNESAVLFESRKRQARTFPSVTPHEPVVEFVWEISAPTLEVRRSLDELCARTSYLGHSSSLVCVRGVDEHAPPTLVPVDRGGSMTLRVPCMGQFDALEHAFSVYVDTGIRSALPCAYQAYEVTTEPQPEPDPASVFEEMIVFERAGKSPQLPIEACARVATVFRAATMTAAGTGAPEVITGHASNGARTTRPHVAYMAIPDTAHAHADGHLLGVAAVIPRDLADAERATVYRALLDVTHLTLGRVGRWEIRRAGADVVTRGLRASTWSEPSDTWATVTPIELDTFPDQPYGDEAELSVARACERIGLPSPIEVTVAPDSVFAGVPPWHRFVRSRPASSRPRRPLVHAAVRFARPVTGPVLLGAGRFAGLGLLRPLGR